MKVVSMSAGNAVRTITYHSVTNNGAVLQAYSLCEALRQALSGCDVGMLDYLPRAVRRYEFFKIFKPLRGAPLFYLQRYLMFRRFVRANLVLDRTVPATGDLQRLLDWIDSRQYRALIVGSDNVWRISETGLSPGFPNVYWLSDRIKARKIAYAVSAYGSDPQLVDRSRETVRRLLNAFDLIGVRDELTLDLVLNAGIDPGIPVCKVPDPTFLYDIRKTNVAEKLAALGVDWDRPSLGILIFGKAALSAQLADHYRAKGYQILALSMYNPYADFNLGHVLDPFEWAEVFRYLTFCVTDRFHGTIFCLKNRTPFVSIEPRALDSVHESKIHSLLRDMDLLACYADVDYPGFQVDEFLRKCMEVLETWKECEGKVSDGLKTMRRESCSYIEKVSEVVNGA